MIALCHHEHVGQLLLEAEHMPENLCHPRGTIPQAKLSDMKVHGHDLRSYAGAMDIRKSPGSDKTALML